MPVSRDPHWRKTQECHGFALGGGRVYKEWMKCNKSKVHCCVILIQVRCTVKMVCFMLWHNLNSASCDAWAKSVYPYVSLNKVYWALMADLITLSSGQVVPIMFVNTQTHLTFVHYLWINTHICCCFKVLISYKICNCFSKVMFLRQLKAVPTYFVFKP